MSEGKNPFRLIGVEEIRGTLETIATLAVSDAELAERGIVLGDAAWEDGLGPARWAQLELATGIQFGVRRLEYVEENLDVYAPLTIDVQRALEELLPSLGLPAECVRWSISAESWADLRDLYKRARDRPT